MSFARINFTVGSNVLYLRQVVLSKPLHDASFCEPSEISQSAICSGVSFVPNPMGGILEVLLLNLEVSLEKRSWRSFSVFMS
jgi:hypothetical protein